MHAEGELSDRKNNFAMAQFKSSDRLKPSLKSNSLMPEIIQQWLKSIIVTLISRLSEKLREKNKTSSCHKEASITLQDFVCRP